MATPENYAPTKLHNHKFVFQCPRTEICCTQAHSQDFFATRRSYASAVLGVVILSVRPYVRTSVCHTRAL